MDRNGYERHEAPSGWHKWLPSKEVEFLPVGGGGIGWCTNADTLIDVPNTQVYCGGNNTKGPWYAAIWRQGFLMHFGFEASPEEMNEVGRTMLLNSVVAIARFPDDHPGVQTPGSTHAEWTRSRDVVDRLTKMYADQPSRLSGVLHPRCLEMAKSEGISVIEWYQRNRGFLCPESKLKESGANKLTLDEEVLATGNAFDSFEFLDQQIDSLLHGGANGEQARQLLDRYVLDGPGLGATPVSWKSWWLARRDYLYFCDGAGFHWCVDELAQRRAVPTRELRGDRRASLSYEEVLKPDDS